MNSSDGATTYQSAAPTQEKRRSGPTAPVSAPTRAEPRRPADNLRLTHVALVRADARQWRYFTSSGRLLCRSCRSCRSSYSDAWLQLPSNLSPTPHHSSYPKLHSLFTNLGLGRVLANRQGDTVSSYLTSQINFHSIQHLGEGTAVGGTKSLCCTPHVEWGPCGYVQGGHAMATPQNWSNEFVIRRIRLFLRALLLRTFRDPGTEKNVIAGL